MRGLYGSLQRKATATANDGVRMVSSPAAGRPAKHNRGLQREFWIYTHAESSALVFVLAGERSDLCVLEFSCRSSVGFPGKAAFLVDLQVVHRVHGEQATRLSRAAAVAGAEVFPCSAKVQKKLARIERFMTNLCRRATVGSPSQALLVEVTQIVAHGLRGQRWQSLHRGPQERGRAAHLGD